MKRYLFLILVLISLPAAASSYSTLVDAGEGHESLLLTFPGDYVKASETLTSNQLVREYVPRGTSLADWQNGTLKERVSLVLRTPPANATTPEVTWAEMSANGYAQMAARTIDSSVTPIVHEGRPAALFSTIVEIPEAQRIQMGAQPGPLLGLTAIFIRSGKDVYCVEQFHHYGDWKSGVMEADLAAAKGAISSSLDYLKSSTKLCATASACL
jgi:hypothetical protein